MSTFLRQFDEEQQANIREQASLLAEKWIRQEQAAVLAVTDALQTGGVLDGPDAERIIKAALTGQGV